MQDDEFSTFWILYLMRNESFKVNVNQRKQHHLLLSGVSVEVVSPKLMGAGRSPPGNRNHS